MEYVEPIRNKADIEKIKNIFIKRSYRDYFMFTLGINNGLTPTALVQLKVKNVKYNDFICMKGSKKNKDNKFPIIPELKSEIDKYIEGINDEDYLFPSKKILGKPITTDRLYIIMRNIGREIGLEHLGSHTLRKTFGYHYYMRTGDIGFLVEIFNHSSKKATFNYIGVDADYRRESLKNGFL